MQSDKDLALSIFSGGLVAHLVDCTCTDIKPWRAEFEHKPSGFRFAMNEGGYAKQRFYRFTPISLEDPSGYRDLPTREGAPKEIYVSKVRPVAKAAIDVQRRLIEPWLPYWGEIVTKQNDRFIEFDRCRKLIEDLAVLSGGHVHTSHRNDHVMSARLETGDYETSVYVSARVVRSKRADLEIHNVTREQAEAILKIITG